ncbi:MAG: major capsid protein [Planctomycetaceae bacterium]|nr:major capsid protein [Planctomycetaceae bacterium]
MVAPSTAIIRYELSAPFTEFDLMMNRKRYIAPQVLRPRIVSVQAANVGKIKLKELLQQHDTLHAGGAGYKRGNFTFDKYSYATEEHGWEEPMTDRDLALYRDLIDAEDIHSQRAMSTVCDHYERDVAAAIYDTAVWSTAALKTAVSVSWNTPATADPIGDIIAAREKIVTGSGLEPNALIMNRLQFDHLKNTEQIVDRVKYTSEANQEKMAAAVAECLGVKHLLVAGGLTNTANSQQTAAISRIWSNDKAMLARVAETDDPKEPCIGRTFIWNEEGTGSIGDGEELAVIVEEYREENVRGSVMRARNDRDIQIMYKEAGHLLTGVLT